MSFKSLVNKLMKEGKSKEAATKIAGKVASEKMKGAGSGPTAKQKARMKKSPATKRKKEKITGYDLFGGGGETTGTRTTITRGNKKIVKTKKKFASGTKTKSKVKTNDPGAEVIKPGDGEGIMPGKVQQGKYVIKRKAVGESAETGKKVKQKKTIKSTYVDDKEVKRKVKQKTPARMKKSPATKYDRVVLGGNKGDKSKTKLGKKDYESPAKLKKPPTKKPTKPGKIEGMKDKGKKKPTPRPDGSPAKKPLTGKQKSLPDHLKKAILDAPAKMLSKSGMKMMKEGSPATLSKKHDRLGAKAKKLDDKSMDPNKPVSEKKFNKLQDKRDKVVSKRKEIRDEQSPAMKSKQRVEQDYARNAIADYKAGKKKEAKYEKKKALEVAAGESVAKMKKSPSMMKTNQDGGGYAAKNMAAPAKQLKKLGSILSKHMKSN